MKKKKAFTLLEIMIVIFLIGLIGSIIGYNMKSSLEEGKAFKTRQAQMKIQEIFQLEIAKGADPREVVENPVKFLKASGIVRNPEKMIVDGWGEKFSLSINNQEEIKIFSKKYNAWKMKKRVLRGKEIEDDE